MRPLTAASAGFAVLLVDFRVYGVYGVYGVDVLVDPAVRRWRLLRPPA